MEGDGSKAPPTTMEDNSSLPSMKNSGKEKATSSSRSANNDVLHMERNRREKMSEFYTMLQSMVPNLFPRATRARVIDETIAYIKALEEVIIALDAEKKAIEVSTESVALQTQRSSSVNLTVSGETQFFGINMVSRPGLVTQVMQVFEKHKSEVLAATIACNDGNSTITVTTMALEEEAVERIKADLMTI